MDPLITIGICVRNSETFVKHVIDTILNQDFPHERMEIIFVDDGSEDRTLSVIKNSVSKIDIPTRVFHQEWKGLGTARNAIVNNARGKYIIWVDADTLLSKDYVRKQASFMEQNKNVGICYGVVNVPFEGNSALTLELIPLFIDYKLEIDQKEMKKLPGTAGSTYRVEAIRQMGGFDSNIRGTGEDLDAAYRIQRAGWLIRQGEGVIYETHGFMSSWKDLWDMYFWHGFTSLYLYKQKKKQFSLPRMTPPAGFAAGFLYSITAYKMLNRKIVFLLPLHFAFKMCAWCLGFFKNQISGTLS
jgi:glycosyltransferase involved in cell wall biosynthesis